MILSARHLCYALPQRTLLQDICFDLHAGECVALLGANGAGKSTLLRLLLRLISPQSGAVLLDGQPLAGMKRRDIARRIAWVPQQHQPHFPFTAWQVVMQGRLPATGLGRGPSAQDEQRVAQAFADGGIAHLAARNYTRLSGGERQQVLITRALVQDTPLILLDEPVNGLDYGHQLQLLAQLKTLAAGGRTLLTITHQPEHALIAASRVLVLHEGRLIADGAPHDVVNSALISRIYQAQVRQVDLNGGHRFFIP
ncbi:ABC transporter ATP-binding protein [Affinibrenneria salicis]|uniref:ABC transporter ATP-binding protein n=1 Tax=Affinibrenneria salicis TaxID=2590031 RepID=A0A5J5FTY8_9GAMM|nr:ABC transporter ATP-binding protein [Affinibrenneria salicis]KAA8996633.1 ABC transporter ATP-binding protein [Affinibrenneria salicis]